MIFRLIQLAAFAALSLLLLTACTPVALQNAANEQDKFAKTFSAPDNKSLIYVYLDEPTPGIAKHVLIDGRIAGMVRPSFYLMSNVTPGQHRVGVGHREENSILLDTDQGRTYFITAHASCADGNSHVQLQMVEESIGKQHILESRLANITLFGRPLLNDRPNSGCGSPSGTT